MIFILKVIDGNYFRKEIINFIIILHYNSITIFECYFFFIQINNFLRKGNDAVFADYAQQRSIIYYHKCIETAEHVWYKRSLTWTNINVALVKHHPQENLRN